MLRADYNSRASLLMISNLFLATYQMELFSKLKNLRILLIDDDEWIRDSLRFFFESEGCSFVALGSAEQAIEDVKQHRYDIIFIDYRLPGIDGLDFLERIKDIHPNAMKVLLTAYKTKDVMDRAFSMGVDDFIEKPFTSKNIEQSLYKLVERREKH